MGEQSADSILGGFFFLDRSNWSLNARDPVLGSPLSSLEKGLFIIESLLQITQTAFRQWRSKCQFQEYRHRRVQKANAEARCHRLSPA